MDSATRWRDWSGSRETSSPALLLGWVTLGNSDPTPRLDQLLPALLSVKPLFWNLKIFPRL